MFRNIQKLFISSYHIDVEFIDGLKFNQEILNRQKTFDFTLSQARYNMNDGSSVQLDYDSINIITSNGNKEIPLPPEMRSLIKKDLTNSRTFDFNYRRHLQVKYSKKHFQLIEDGNLDEFLDTYPDMMEGWQKLKIAIEEYSSGFENMRTLVVNCFDGDAIDPRMIEFKLCAISLSLTDMYQTFEHRFGTIFEGEILEDGTLNIY